MKKIIESKVFLAFTGIMTGISLFFFLYLCVTPFEDYAFVFYRFMSGGSLLDLNRQEKIVETATLLLITLAFFALFNYSIKLSSRRLSKMKIHIWDYYFSIMIGIALIVILGEQYIINRYSWFFQIVFFVLIFLVAIHIWSTTAVRIYEKNIYNTVYWCRIFDVMALKTFSGIFVVAVIFITSIFIFYNYLVFLYVLVESVYYVDIEQNYYLLRFFLYICIPLLIQVSIAIFGRSVVRLTSEREHAANIAISEERMRSELIANVTHDIRTPLTSIINYVDLISKLENKDEKLIEYVDILKSKSERLKNLVDDLLEASKASAGNIDVNIEKINISEIIGQVIGDYDESMTSANLTYVNPYSENNYYILADGNLLWRVLENIFSNVVKYAMPDTRVYVDLTETNDFVELSIKNVSKNKLNLPADELLKQFVRGEQARTQEGSGLGLFIAEHLTNLMNVGFEISISGDLFVVKMTFNKNEESDYE